jgi:acetolactate synthase-1/2/3 large subunit
MTKTFKGTGGQILAKALSQHGVRHISCVAGESYLPVLDALLDHPEIKVFTCRHESGAGFMAEAWGKLTGHPGVVFVTRGPGVCNASIAVHTARQDSTPMILFMGQVRRGERTREAFQEVSVERVFGSMAKWAADIDDAARIPEFVNRAFHIAMSGRPGPVVLGLPEDMLSALSEAQVGVPPLSYTPSAPPEGAVNLILEKIAAARRPLVIIGGAGWIDAGIADFESFCSAAHLPVAVSFRRHDLFDHRHACYVGELGTGTHPKLAARVHDADLILAMGARLNEITTQGYTLLGEPPEPRAEIIHVHLDAAEIGKVYRSSVGLSCDVNALAGALAARFSADGRAHAEWAGAARQDYETWTHIPESSVSPWQGADMTDVFRQLRDILPVDAIVTSDAGNFSGWAQRYLRYGRPGRFLGPLSGAMGYGVPSAIAASLAHPEKCVVGLCGDGGFMMTANELATAIHHGAKPVILVCNNGLYGTIRMHQERKYPGRPAATDLTNPDFVAFARSFGAFSERVDQSAGFTEIFAAARKSGRAAVIEICMDPRQITTNAVFSRP